MRSPTHSTSRSLIRTIASACLLGTFSLRAVAQGNPFDTGANSLVDEFTTIATPIAILVVMVLGVVALSGRISWGWPIAAIAGIAVLFGAPQIVAWIQGVFGV